MNYRLTTSARNGLRDIYQYTVKNFGQTQAELYLGGLDYTFDLLTDNPKLGQQAGENTYRYLYKGHYVFYMIEGDTTATRSTASCYTAYPQYENETARWQWKEKQPLK